jgi:transposase
MVDQVPEAYLAPEAVVANRVITRARQQLTQAATSACNSIRSFFAQLGIDAPPGRLDSKAARKQMPALIQSLPDGFAQAATGFWTVLICLWAQIDALEREIATRVKADPVASALVQLPGIGPNLALALVAEIGQIERFVSTDKLHSYAGVVPQVRQSGTFRAQGGLSDRCNKRLRYVAVLAAQCAARTKTYNEPKRAYERVRRRSGPNSAKIAAARKLLNAVFFTWRETIGC